MADGGELGHAVALHDLAADAGAGLGGGLRRQRRCAREHVAQRAEVELRDHRVLGQRHDDRRRDVAVGDPVLLMRAQKDLEVEARHGHQRGARRQAAVHHHLHAVDVEERQHRHHDVLLAHTDGRVHLQHVGDQVGVRQHHALRQARRARRIRECRHIAGRVRYFGRRRQLRGRRAAGRLEHGVERRRASERGCGRFVHQQQFVDPRAPDGGACRGEAAGHGDEPGSAGIHQLVVYLALGVARVDRGHRAAGEHGAVEHHRVLGLVRHQDRQHFAMGETATGQVGRQQAHLPLEFAVAEAAPRGGVDQRGLVLQARGLGEHQFGDRDCRDVEPRQRAAVDPCRGIR